MIFTSLLSLFALSLLLTGILWMLKKSFEILPSLEYKKVNLSFFIRSHSPAGCKWHVVNLKFYLAFLKFSPNSRLQCHLKDFSSSFSRVSFSGFFHSLLACCCGEKLSAFFFRFVIEKIRRQISKVVNHFYSPEENRNVNKVKAEALHTEGLFWLIFLFFGKARKILQQHEIFIPKKYSHGTLMKN